LSCKEIFDTFKEIFDTFMLVVPLFLTSTYRGAGELPGVTGPKSYAEGETCMEEDCIGSAPDWLDPSPPPPPLPHPKIVMENSIDVININLYIFPLIIIVPSYDFGIVSNSKKKNYIKTKKSTDIN
jgi:hypothetical protein